MLSSWLSGTSPSNGQPNEVDTPQATGVFARSAATKACFAAAEGSDDLLEAAALAKAWCSEAYFDAAADTIQIHGGMGFTWEHPAHLYFKRTKASDLLFGDAAHHREQLADQLGI